MTTILEETVMEDASVPEHVAHEIIINGRNITFISAGPYIGYLQGQLYTDYLKLGKFWLKICCEKICFDTEEQFQPDWNRWHVVYGVESKVYSKQNIKINLEHNENQFTDYRAILKKPSQVL